MTERRKNILLAVAVTLIGYAIIDFGIYRNFLDKVPLELHPELGRLQYVAQTSKDGIVPKDYILMLGDSFAEGLGDWRYEAREKGGNPPFHSAHILHDLTGRDVMTFGVRGGHPSFAYTLHATRAFEGLQLYAGLDLDQPTDVLAYFTEGNDVDDEMFMLGYHFDRSYDRDRLFDEDYYMQFLYDQAKTGESMAHRRWHVLRNANLIDFASKLVKLNIKRFNQGTLFRSPPKAEPNLERLKNTRNHVLVQGKSVPYPDATAEVFAFQTEDEIRTTGYILKNSLRYLQEYFDKARVWLVYIPGNIATYDLTEGTAVLRERVRYANREEYGEERVFTQKEIRDQSDVMCRYMAKAAAARNVAFIDTRPYLREAAKEKGLLHGPIDWGHPNKKGYTALAEAIVEGMRAGGHGGCLSSPR